MHIEDMSADEIWNWMADNCDQAWVRESCELFLQQADADEAQEGEEHD